RTAAGDRTETEPHPTERIHGASSGGLEDRLQRAGEPRPALSLLDELLAAGGRERIDLGAAPLGRLAPVGLDQPALLEAVECRVQRPRVHLQHVARDSLDAETQVVAVGRLGLE